MSRMLSWCSLERVRLRKGLHKSAESLVLVCVPIVVYRQSLQGQCHGHASRRSEGSVLYPLCCVHRMALLCTQVTQEVLCSHLPQSSAGASSKCDGNLGHSAAPIMLRDRGTQETGREGRSRAGVELFGKVSVGSLGIQVLPENLFSSVETATRFALHSATVHVFAWSVC